MKTVAILTVALSLPLTVQASEHCETMGHYASVIMKHRQQGTDKRIVEMANEGQPNTHLLNAITEDAYKQPQHNLEWTRKKKVEVFAQAIYDACVEHENR